jgi:hypothetical protein
MALVPVRLAPAWTCPVHAATIADAAGTCPICRRQLVPVTVSLTWTCRGSSEQHLEPGTCADGTPRTRTRTLRPHGDHNPRHGGQFFMAADNWHHVEGVHPAPGLFRLYVYDDYARPLAADRMKSLQGRVSITARPDARTSAAARTVPLRVAANSGYLEAQLDRTPLPVEVSARVRFARGGEEYQFDFTFPGLTPTDAPASRPAATAPPPPPGSRATRAPAAPGRAGTPAAVTPAITRDTTERGAPAQDPALVPLPIPDRVPDILAQMRTRTEQIGTLIARGDFAAVWVPAFAAKDLALALEPHVARLDPARRDAASEALQRVVRLAWLLDAHGDTGNRQQLLAAHASFSTAVADAVRAFASLR